MPVAREELADAERPLAMRRPEDHDVADAAGDQLHPPQDEGAHKDGAQLAVGLHEGQQVVAIDFNDFAVRAHADLRQPRAARQHRRFAREHPGAERHHDLLGGRRADDIDLTRHHDEESRHLLPRLRQHLPGRDVAPAPVGSDASELRGRQCRIQTLGPLDGGRGRRGRWGNDCHNQELNTKRRAGASQAILEKPC